MSTGADKGLILKYRPTRGLGPYIFSLLIIIIPATTAYYFHLQNQTNYHQKRAFRALDEAGRLLDRNIEAFGKLRPKIRKDGLDQNEIQTWIDEKSLAIQQSPIFKDINFNLTIDKEQFKKFSGVGTSKLRIKRDQGQMSLVQEFCSGKLADPDKDIRECFFKSTISLDPLLADLRQRREFDVIALVRPDGDVFYSTETERSDFFSGRPGEQSVSRTKRYSNVTRLLQLASCKLLQNGEKPAVDKACNEDFELGQAAFVEIDGGDATKLVFIQPYSPQQEEVFCDFKSNGCTSGPAVDKKTGYIVGVIDAGRFNGRVQSLPPNIVAGVTLFVLIGLLLAPYLRIALGGPLASISRLFTGYLLSAGVLSTGLTIILLLWATLGRSILETSEYSAKQIASDIEADVREELIEILGVYKCLRDQTFNSSLKSVGFGVNVCGIQGNKSVRGLSDGSSSGDIGSHYDRPPFRVMFFANAGGKSIGDEYVFDFLDSPLKGIDVSGRDYFKQASANGLSLNRFQDAGAAISALPAFAIQRIMSYSTGSLSTAIAIPEQGIEGHSPLSKAKVGIISGPLQSLSAPVLPNGFHFAIIEDDTGLVIAHDNTSRVLVEDFFREADDNAELLASVKGRQDNGFHGKYHGRQSFFYTRAIQGLPWSVVVIQDKTLVQMSRLEIAAIALGELLLIFMVIGFCILGTIIFWRREPWAWLWPMRRNIFDCHPSIFWIAIIVLLGVLIAGVGVIFNFSGFWLIYWTAIVMLSGAHLMYLVSAQPYDVMLLRHRRWRTPAVLVLALFLSAGLLIKLYGSYTSDVVSFIDCLMFVVTATALLITLTVGFPECLQIAWDKARPGTSCFNGGDTKDEKNENSISKSIVSEPLRRFRHVSAGVLCLLMFGGLPSGAAFKDAYETYMDLIFRHSAIDAAVGFDNRVGQLRRYIGSLGHEKSKSGGLDWTKGYGFANNKKNRGIFLNDGLLSGASGDDPSRRLGYAAGNAPREWKSVCNEVALPGLASFVIDKAFSVDERMARLHLAQDNCSDDERWYWREDLKNSSINFNYLTKNGLPGGGYNTNWMVLTFNPSVFYTYSTFYTIVFILLLPVYIGILYFQVSITGARLGGTRIPFILHRSGKPRPNQGKVDFERLSFKHRMVLRASDSHIYTKGPRKTAWKCEILKLDTACEYKFIRLQKVLDSNPGTEVKILHLAILTDDVEQRRKILPLLECLVKENLETKITLYADFNPLYRLTRPDAYRDNTSEDAGFVRDRESLRWSSLLSRFAKEYAWAPRDNLNWLDWKDKDKVGDLTCAREMRIFHPESEVEALLKNKLFHARKEGLYSVHDDIPAEDIIALACELGGAYYRKLWEECTHNERVLLHAIAAGRCVNTLNIEIISHLMRRGLLVMEPSLSLVNESFAEFIREAETPETYQHWQNDEQEKGAWQALRVPFMFLLFVPIAILLVVATEELNSVIALMTPILTVIPMLMKGFGLRSPGT
ncbi:MAG: cache domain-containing protein [Gammaproteobacteria bacterium]|nr:cache domain-containing protein [Gammaproteobacteria bacterium]